MAFLRTLDGSRTIPLRPRLTLIGRDRACDVVVARNEVSGRHAVIINVGGSYFVEDLHSLNGTEVNGQRIAQRTLLRPDDRLEVPGLAATFHDADNSLPRVVLSSGSAADGAHPPSVLTTLDVSTRPRVEVAPQAKLRAVLEIADALGNALALEKVLPTILESLFTIFPKATRGFILLNDPSTGQLVPKAVHLHGAAGAAPPALSLTVINHALATGKAVLTVDAGQDERFNSSESIRQLKLQSIMCVPMVGPTGNSLGVIQIDTVDSAGIFGQEDLDVLVCASTQAARAIEVARLHEELRDLEAANRIQHSFLPEGRPQVPGLEFFDYYAPARQVGGDYFDYIPLPGNRLAVALGDVAGKGIAAALMMARLSAAARFCLASTPNVAQAVGQLNRDLARTFGDDRFATFVVGVLDLDQFTLTLVNAGHLPPLRCRARAGCAEPLGADFAGLALAGIDWPYESTTVALEPGDTVVFLTDGVTEARNPRGEFYGMERLRTVLSSGCGSAETVGAAILADVNRFTAGCPQSDDLTVVAFGRQP